MFVEIVHMAADTHFYKQDQNPQIRQQMLALSVVETILRLENLNEDARVTSYTKIDIHLLVVPFDISPMHSNKQPLLAG